MAVKLEEYKLIEYWKHKQRMKPVNYFVHVYPDCAQEASEPYEQFDRGIQMQPVQYSLQE